MGGNRGAVFRDGALMGCVCSLSADGACVGSFLAIGQ